MVFELIICPFVPNVNAPLELKLPLKLDVPPATKIEDVPKVIVPLRTTAPDAVTSVDCKLTNEAAPKLFTDAVGIPVEGIDKASNDRVCFLDNAIATRPTPRRRGPCVHLRPTPVPFADDGRRS